VLTFLYGAGLGFANTPLLVGVQTSVPWSRRGVATASTMFFRTIGGTLSVGLLGGVLANALAGAGASREVVEKLLGPERVSLDPAAVAGLSTVLQGAMSTVFWAAAAIATAALAVSFTFPRLEVAPRAAPPAAPGDASERPGADAGPAGP
jgi:hypothetical protein